MKKSFGVLGLFALLIVSLLSVAFVSAEGSANHTVWSNLTNTTWIKGNANYTQMINITYVGQTGVNISNFTIVNSNFTFYNNVVDNFTQWGCIVNSSFVANGIFCNNTVFPNGNSSLSIQLNVTYTAPSVEYEINHSLNITLTSNSTVLNITRLFVQVDGLGPTGSVPVFTNATAFNKNTTTKLILNISASDLGSGLTGSFCIVNINGTNQSKPVSSGWCNFTDGNLTNLADGSHQMLFYLNDTKGTIRLNSTNYVVTDTVNPAATATCSPSSVNVGAAFPCTCSGSDATAGLNSSLTSGSSTSPDGIATTANSGSFTYTCAVTDYAGNSHSLTATYSVSEGGNSGSGSGGSATTTVVATPAKSETFAQITPGAASIVKDFNAETGLKEIQIEVNNPAQSVKVTVTRYSGKPAAVSVEKTGDVYQYLQIAVTNIADKLDKATITSKVTKTWVAENGLDFNNLALFKFDETAKQWNEVATTYDSEDSTYYYYTSEVNSFSYFAIGEKSVVAPGGEAGGTTTTGGEIPAASTMPWVWIVIGAVVLVAVVVFLVMKKRR